MYASSTDRLFRTTSTSLCQGRRFARAVQTREAKRKEFVSGSLFLLGNRFCRTSLITTPYEKGRGNPRPKAFDIASSRTTPDTPLHSYQYQDVLYLLSPRFLCCFRASRLTTLWKNIRTLQTREIKRRPPEVV